MYVVFNYRRTMNQENESFSPLFFLALWSVCLAYFFGFFGISFLDTEAISESPSTFGLAEVQRQAQATRHAEDAKALEKPKTQKTTKTVPVQAKTAVHAPRNDTVICSEKPLPTDGSKLDAEVADIDDVAFETLDDDEVFDYLLSGSLKDYQLEKRLGDYERAVGLRRRLYEHLLDKKLDLIPYAGYDYNKVFGANCEIVIGYVPIPVGVVGPLTINGEPIYIPMATTEGCLVASTNRGCKAISASGGCQSVLLKDAITRAPCLRLPSAMRAAAVKRWVETPENYNIVEEAFNSTTNYGRLNSVDATIAGRNVYLRFCCMSGDAMGMNMVSKGCLKVSVGLV